MRAKTSAFLILAAAAAAQGGPEPIPVELRERFGFTGPRIVKIGFGINNLQMSDLDGDGDMEILVADPRRAKIVMLQADGDEVVQEPVPTGGQIAGYTAADFNGDGKAQIVMVDGRGRLQLRGEDPEAARSRGPALDLGLGGRSVLLLANDLDGDGASDLVAISENGMRMVTQLDEATRLSPIESLENNANSFLVEDLDADNDVDIAYVAPGDRMNLRMRLGQGDGSFGPWLVGAVEQLQHVFLAESPDGAPALATIEGPHRRVALYKLGENERGAAEWWPFAESARGPLPHTVADVNGDGELDLVVAQPNRAELLVFESRNGSFVPRAVPSLSGIGCLAAGDVDGDGVTDLVMTSPEEGALAWKSGNLPMDAFPVRLSCKDKPIAAAVADGTVYALCRTDRRQARVDAVKPGGEAETVHEIGRLPADPMRMVCADIGEGEGQELAFVVPGEGLRIIDAAADAKGGREARSAGFTRKIEDGSFSLAPSGKELLVVRDKFLRTFRVDKDGAPVVIDQDNGPAGVSQLSLVASLPDGDRLYLDRQNQKLVRSAPGEAAWSYDVPPLDYTHLLAIGDAAVLLSSAGVLRIPFGSGPGLTPGAVHEPPSDRTNYWAGTTGDLDNDGVAELVVVDRRLPGPQILTWEEDRLARALAIPVFEIRAGGGAGEPREMRIGDFDGDGREDLVLLAHDRVLIYLQEE